MTVHIVYDRDWTWWLGEATSLLLVVLALVLTVLLVTGWRRDKRSQKTSTS